MRCQFCGWDNPQGKETCEKCNKPLTGNVSTESQSAYDQDYKDRPTDRRVSGEQDPAQGAEEGRLRGERVTGEYMSTPQGVEGALRLAFIRLV